MVLPEYDQLVADVPAEKRPAAVLAKKMASLNANTAATRGSAVTAKDLPDFMNKYGDEVAVRAMADYPELNERMDNPIKFDEHGKPHTGGEGAMRKLTGRIPLLRSRNRKNPTNCSKANTRAIRFNVCNTKKLLLPKSPKTHMQGKQHLT